MPLLNSRTRRLAALASLAVLTSCAGTRNVDGHGTVYAYSFNLIGISIPFNDYDEASSMVPANAEIETVISNPRDWTSLAGILTSIFGFSGTQISYVYDED